MPRKITRILSLFLCFLLIFEQTGFAQVLPSALATPLSSSPLLRYLSVNPANPFNYFNFLLDKGLSPQSTNTTETKGTVPDLTKEAQKLLNYFFLGITLPSSSFWVNLKPDSPEKITSEELAKTDLGRVLLEQDLKLKKDVSRFLHPNHPQGKEFWERLYSTIGKDKAKKAKITTSNRVWIVPEEATVLETEDGALVVEAKLKVLLESEYLSLKTKGLSPKGTDPTTEEETLRLISEQLMKEIVLPALTQDINTSSTYAPLRQIYHSLILAEWFKRRVKAQGLSPQLSNTTETKRTVPKTKEILSSPYALAINKGYTKGLESEAPWEKDTFFQQYLKSYSEGEYKLEAKLFGLRRMYWSGGVLIDLSGGSAGLGSSPLTIVTQKELENNPNSLSASFLEDESTALVTLEDSALTGKYGKVSNVIVIGKPKEALQPEGLSADKQSQPKEGASSSASSPLQILFNGETREFKLLLISLLHSQGSVDTVRQLILSSGAVIDNTEIIKLIFSKTNVLTIEELIQEVNLYVMTESNIHQHLEEVVTIAKAYGKDYSDTAQAILAVLSKFQSQTVSEVNLGKDSGRYTYTLNYTKPIILILAPETGGEKKLIIYRHSDIPDEKLRNSLNPNVGYFIVSPDNSDEYKGLRNTETVEIGRFNPGRFNLSMSISRQHIRITRLGNEIQITDLYSTYGTKIILKEEAQSKKKESWKKEITEDEIRKQAQVQYPIPRRWTRGEALKALGLPYDASDDTIKKTYRNLARELHPDMQNGKDLSKQEKIFSEERFKQISSAYTYLTNNKQVSSPLTADQSASSAVVSRRPLEIKPEDIMEDSIIKGKLGAHQIFSILSVVDPKLELEIRKDIARRVNDTLDLDTIDLDSEVDSLIVEFKGETLNRDEIKVAFEKAIKYKIILPLEEEALAYFQDSSRFLSLSHPLVSTLQGYLDEMAEPGLPKSRLLVAIDAKGPIAFSLGQTIVISLPLISKLTTIDEIVAILAHEQVHHESNCRNNWPEIEQIRTWLDVGVSKEGIKRIASGLLKEVQADLIGRKLAKVNLNTLALSEALPRLQDPRSQNFSHLNIPRRNIVILFSHVVNDYEAGRSLGKQDIPIPASWKLAKITPSLMERIFYQKFNRDFKEAVSQASPRILRKGLEVFSSQSNYRKLLCLMDRYLSLINLEGEKHNWSFIQEETIGLLYLILGLSPYRFEGVMREYFDFGLFKLDFSLYRIKRIIKQKATAIARHLYFGEDNDSLNRLIGKTHLDIRISSRDLIALLDSLWAYSDERALGIMSRTKDKTYLTDSISFLKKLGQFVPEAERKEWFSSKVGRIISGYALRYWKWKKYLSIQKNTSYFIEYLKEANQQYVKELNIDPKELYEGMRESWKRLVHYRYLPLTHGELMNRLFNIPIPKAPDSPLSIFNRLLQSKNETTFIQYIDEYYNDISYDVSNVLRDTDIQTRIRESNRHWLTRMVINYIPAIERYLGAEGKIYVGQENRAADYKKIHLTFKNDLHLSEWIFQVLLKYANAAQPGSETEKTAEENSKIIQRFIWILKAITLLPVSAFDERLKMVRAYLETEVAERFIRLMSLAELKQVCDVLNGLFVFNVEEMKRWRDLLGRDVPLSYRDKQLVLPPYFILKERLLSDIENASNLQEASKAYWDIIDYSNNIYGRSRGVSRIIGQSQFHNDWLLPVNAAYFRYLENELKTLPWDSKETIDYYFAVDSPLFTSERKRLLLSSLAKKMVERLSDESLKDFLVKLAEKRSLDAKLYNYFVQKRINTKEQFQYFKQARDDYLEKNVGEGRFDLGSLFLIGNVLDKFTMSKKQSFLKEALEQIIGKEYYASLFAAMMESGNSDINLRKQLAFPWFLGSLAKGITSGYDIDFIDRQLKVTGEGRADFIPFNEFINLLYNASSAEKLIILQKILLGPLGLLNTKRGRGLFAETLAENLPQHGPTTDLLKDILRASSEVLDSERLFYLLAQPILAVFLKRPQQEDESISVEKLAKQMRQELVRWNFGYGEWGIGISALLSSLMGRKLRKRDFNRFLRKYRERLTPSISREKVDVLVNSLSHKLERKLEVKAASSALIQTGRDKDKKGSLRLNTLQPIEIIIQACQSLGPMGARFLQITGQYLPLSDEEQERFRDVYDSSKQQDKFIAFDTLLETAAKDPVVKRFVDEDLVSIDERVGGGSIVTVFTTTVRNRDANGNRIEGTHREILKVRNPNAETFVRQVYEEADKIIEELIRTNRRSRKNYEIARHLLSDIREWVIQDIRDDTFLELDSKYEEAHLGYFASNGMAVRVAPAMTPNNKDVKRETYVPGPTLNKLFKLKLSGKSLEELINEENKKEEPDVELLEFLANLRLEGFTLDDMLKKATEAWIEDFSRHLVEPIFKKGDGQDVYLLHSDVHSGNAIIHPDLKTVYPIDRNFYLQLDKGEVDFIRKILTAPSEQELAFLSGIMDYFLNLPQNQDNPLNHGNFAKLGKQLLLFRIGARIKRLKDQNPLSVMMRVLQGLVSKKIEIPLNLRIVFKNLISINAMLSDTSIGTFSDYIRKVESSIPAASPLTSEPFVSSEAGRENIISWIKHLAHLKEPQEKLISMIQKLESKDIVNKKGKAWEKLKKIARKSFPNTYLNIIGALGYSGKEGVIKALESGYGDNPDFAKISWCFGKDEETTKLALKYHKAWDEIAKIIDMPFYYEGDNLQKGAILKTEEIGYAIEKGIKEFNQLRWYLKLRRYFDREIAFYLSTKAIEEAKNNGWSNLEDTPNKAGYYDIKITDLILVHRTNFLPHEGKILTRATATDSSAGRETVHFTLNHSVIDHSGFKWSDKLYTILIPLHLVPKNRIVAFGPVDTFVFDDIELPLGSIVLGIKDTIVPTKANLGNAIFIQVEDMKEDTIDKVITNLGYSVREGGRDNWRDRYAEERLHNLAHEEKVDWPGAHFFHWTSIYESVTSLDPKSFIIDTLFKLTKDWTDAKRYMHPHHSKEEIEKIRQKVLSLPTNIFIFRILRALHFIEGLDGNTYPNVPTEIKSKVLNYIKTSFAYSGIDMDDVRISQFSFRSDEEKIELIKETKVSEKGFQVWLKNLGQEYNLKNIFEDYINKYNKIDEYYQKAELSEEVIREMESYLRVLASAPLAETTTSTGSSTVQEGKSVSSAVGVEKPLPTYEVGNGEVDESKGGIDLSQIELTLKDQKYISSLNPAERQILLAAKYFKEGWESLTLLYVHQIMLMLKDNLIKDIQNKDLLSGILNQLKLKNFLDPQALQFFQFIQSQKPLSEIKVALYR